MKSGLAKAYIYAFSLEGVMERPGHDPTKQEPIELIPRARDPGISELSKPPNHNRLHSTPRPDSAGRVDSFSD